jgi:acyl-[acyl-carrier-protein]-phospholipid O-acyltransferase/long-chain-fatty-acid--[acyl-carrier-protein] ligase
MTTHSPLTLLRSRRFLPLFVTQFLGAANDNLFKNALIILVVYRLGEAAAISPSLMGSIAAALFILPFFLFSATAGQLADRFDKARMMRLVKLAEVVLMAIAAAGFLLPSVPLLLLVLFGMGMHSTFFGPLKYAVLPDHLEPGDLLGGNALIEAGTFLAILIGTIAGGLFILGEHGVEIISVAVVAVALCGLGASTFIPAAPPADATLKVGWNVFGETAAMVRLARQRRDVFLAILGISWFWLVGATYLAQFPGFAKETLRADNQVVTLFLTLFSIGIGIGSMLCSRLLKGEISARHVPAAAVAISVFSLDLALAAGAAPHAADLVGVMAFLAQPASWRIIIDLLLVSICGGIYAVPLYAILQARSEPSQRARAIAANNVMNAAFMVAGAVVTAALLAVGLPVTGVFLLLSAANVVVAVYICGLLSEQTLKGVLAWLLGLAFRVEVRGLGNLAAAGERVLIVSNHVSFLDAALLAAFLPGRPAFAINTRVAGWWWVAPFLKIIDAVQMDPSSPMAVKSLTRAVEAGRHCVIFPEGRITVTGALMKVYDGPGMIADKAGAEVVAVRIEGAQYTLFSRLKGKVKRRLLPKITLTVLPPRRLVVDDNLHGRARRRAAGNALYDILSEAQFAATDTARTLPQALMQALATHGGKAALEDTDRKPLSLRKMVLGALVLGRALTPLAARGDAVGVLLPSAAGTAVTLFALQMFGRVPAMLNLTAGIANLRAACTAGSVNLVLTSRRFVEAARFGDTVAALAQGVRMVYLEDIRARIGLGARLRGLLSLPLAARIHARYTDGAESPAVVLFTSGSEGLPKGVVLSHRNILANCAQLAARVDFTGGDIVFNALPLFHSFGLTGAFLLPLLGGVRVFLYPSPLHYRIVPELVYDTNATIMFGTDTFLAGYARVAHVYDFRSVRYVFAGAEKVKEETRATWIEKFGLRIMEGYGATETAPVIAVNTPTHFKPGSVGRILPGMRWRVVPVPGISRGGRLVVAGPNVMLGYLKASHPGELQPPPGGWYDTGDIVEVDSVGYVTILGRAKRFAKVAGEMVSLAAVEEMADSVWPGYQHAVLALPDPRKGEQLVLLTTAPQAERDALAAAFRRHGISELALPRAIVKRDKLPVLGSGKVDYVSLEAELKL